MAGLVRFEQITKRFGDFTAVDGVSLDIHDGEFFALLGPSGCGKTTLLRLLAGFERPDAGRLLLGGNDLTGVPPYRRPVNMMFQSYALFPHMTVAGNIAFGLKQDGLPKSEIAQRVEEMLALVQLSPLAARKPDQLSGGQRQRVALARSLAKRPKVLLLDEPLAALDRKLREETRFELKAVQQKLRTTFVIVTHDQDEAMTVADRIAVMERGHLAQVGAPTEVYQRPASRWVAGFVGDVNLLDARVSEVYPSFVTLERAGLKLRVTPSAAVAPGESVAVALRPEKIEIAHARPERAADNGAAGVVTEIGYLGAMSIFKVQLDVGMALKAAVMNGASARAIQVKDRVWLSWSADAGVLLAE